MSIHIKIDREASTGKMICTVICGGEESIISHNLIVHLLSDAACCDDPSTLTHQIAHCYSLVPTPLNDPKYIYTDSHAEITVG